MKKKYMFAASSILLAIVCGTGGYIVIRDQRQVAIDRKLADEQLSKVQNITIKEGDSLPDLKESFADASMIDQESIQVNIQNVDSTVPGSYDVICSFNDVHGNQGEKIISCEVQPDLEQHVTGIDDITIDCGKSLPLTETEYDMYVANVVRDDSLVDIEEPGTYTVTYSILGTNGEIENVERLATVLDNKPEPTPDPEEDLDGNSKNKNKGATKKEKTSDKNNTKGTGQRQNQDDLTGNVEGRPENDHTVATADTSPVAGYLLAVFAAAIGAVYTGFRKLVRKK